MSWLKNPKSHRYIFEFKRESYVVQCGDALTNEFARHSKTFKRVGVPAYVSVRLYFYSSTSPFTQIEVCLTGIWDSPVCVFPPLFVLAASRNQEHFCIPKMGFGVEGTFQRFFLTLTPMFSLHIKLLGGPPDYFFLTTLRKNAVPEIIVQKCFALSFFQLRLSSSLSNRGVAEGSDSRVRSSRLFVPFSVKAFTHNTGDVASWAHTQAAENPLASCSHDEKWN